MQSGEAVVNVEVVVEVVVGIGGSVPEVKHWHLVQWSVFTFSTQQSPPSNPHSGVLVASSHWPSCNQVSSGLSAGQSRGAVGDVEVGFVVVVVVVVERITELINSMKWNTLA
jgi:hypothetical protein